MATDLHSNDSIASLLTQSVLCADGSARRPAAFGAQNAVFNFNTNSVFQQQDKKTLENYYIRLRRLDRDDVISHGRPPKAEDIKVAIKDALTHSSALTPPHYVYHRHIAQPLLQLKASDGEKMALDIVRKQKGKPITLRDIEDITAERDMDALMPLAKDLVNLTRAGADVDFHLGNLLCERDEEGRISLHLIDQIDTPPTLEEAGVIDPMIIREYGENFRRSWSKRMGETFNYAYQDFMKLLGEAWEQVLSEPAEYRDAFHDVGHVAAVPIEATSHALVQKLNELDVAAQEPGRRV